jgi:hypothetical protein
MKIIEKMIDHPIATCFVIGVFVDGVSILANNLASVFKKK